MRLAAPEALGERHLVGEFDCGEASLNDWLKRRAARNQASGDSRCFVAADLESRQVDAYYALSSSAITPDRATGRLRRNMPDPIPVVVLARLAIDTRCQGQRLVRALFQDAARRVLHAGEAIGIRGLIVHALSEPARDFYLRLGLEPSPLEPLTLMTTVADLRAALGN